MTGYDFNHLMEVISSVKARCLMVLGFAWTCLSRKFLCEGNQRPRSLVSVLL